MGRVYLGTTQSGRRLAVKIVRAEFADDPEFRRRFQQEVAAAQRVQNFYTAPVIDADLNGPVPWLATAHVPGPSLAQAVFESGPLPAGTVRILAAGVAEALQAIHQAGVIHRDLKPSNVLLAPDGPRVIDFGIARAADATPLTRTGGAVGSPQFMAPEQIFGEPSTPALDVFAFGSLVFFAATGRSPFGEGPAQAVMFRIAQEAPRLDGCPDDLRPLVERCLAKDPADRPKTGEILNELTGITAPTSADWLPGQVTSTLSAYESVPAPPPPARTGPVMPSPGTQYPARSSGIKRTLIAGFSGVVVVLLLAITLVVLLKNGQDKEGSTAAGAASSSPAAVETSGSAPAQSSIPTPTPTPTATGTAGGASQPPGTQLGQYKDIDITSGYFIDFVGNPERPQEEGSNSGDLTFTYGRLKGNNKFGVLAAGQTADYQTCHDNTIYFPDSYRVQKGLRLCVYTETGLLGIVTVKTDNSEYVTLDLTVWQGPADQ
jgi:serine/threonine protein kinase